jgi:haloacetate dehalogenase
MRDPATSSLDRRRLLQRAAPIVAAAAGSLKKAQAQAAKSGTERFFPGFERHTVKTAGATITLVKGGEGPPLLLMHGAPQTHVSWHVVAPQLARDYTVIATDLRGYGESSKPADEKDHSSYSKRAMAQDQVEVMRHFGFEKFDVVGHDRGGRVGHRMALDHSSRVTKLSVLDIVPTHYLYNHVSDQFARAYYHWFFFIQPAPFPETLIGNSVDFYFGRGDSETGREYLRVYRDDPSNIHGMCEDYRASATIDLEHDEADRKQGRKVECPLQTLWAANGAMGRLYDVLAIWKEYGPRVVGKGLPGGHTLQESAPAETLAELQAFLRA